MTYSNVKGRAEVTNFMAVRNYQLANIHAYFIHIKLNGAFLALLVPSWRNSNAVRSSEECQFSSTGCGGEHHEETKHKTGWNQPLGHCPAVHEEN